jgi:glycosyltransferase involved in cell wall biosynthesis
MFNSTLSLIIPAYNRVDLIVLTLMCLLNQTLPAGEIILVEDGSNDSIAEATELVFSVFTRHSLGKNKIPDLKVIRQDNAGTVAPRNRKFFGSKVEYIHFFDSVDIAFPNKDELQVRALQESGSDIAIKPWQNRAFNGSRFRPLTMFSAAEASLG